MSEVNVADHDGSLDGISVTRIPLPDVLSILPLRDYVMFPVLVSPLSVGRENSVKMVNETVVGGNRVIGCVTLKDPHIENPSLDDIYSIGAAAVIRMMMQAPDGIRLIVQGITRFEVAEAVQTEPYLKVRVRPLPETEVSPEQSAEVEAARRTIVSLFQKAVSLSPELPDEIQALATNIQEPGALTDLVAAHMPRLTTVEKQQVLQTLPTLDRMRTLIALLAREVQVLELGSKIHTDVTTELGRAQREYYLREQLKLIQKELGEGDERTREIEELKEKIEAAGMPEEAAREAHRELERLGRMPTAAPEYTVARTYVDWLVALPWATATDDNLSLPDVKAILDADHYGLDRVKERVLEFLAVRRFKAGGELRQPILCFAGPPGVGKTSLGKSIARALGRKFVRISVGGVRDEAEIRGHRRTYIGALPGQIVQGIRRAGSRNPIFMLDEIDKITADFRGDPSSALLEVLDPEQNHAFRDHYLEVPFDLSRVLFITTANMLETVLPPLRDRMEVIELAGYTEEEKASIALKYLVPKQLAEHGITGRLRFSEEAIVGIIRGHTREAGVRNLERAIATVCRKATRAFAEGSRVRMKVTPKQVAEFLGAPRYEREELDERVAAPGVATGLVWTPVGGDIVFIEATAMSVPAGRSSQLTMTGQLGDVMQESAQAALSYVRAHADDLGAEAGFFAHHDIHIHVPAGATPKDGPSAGVAMCVALASLFRNVPVRPRIAMTGELTLTGKVLPVGGIKEKVLAAHRAGVRTVILPKRNEKDLREEVPDAVRGALSIYPVNDVCEALRIALDGPSARPGRRNSGKG